MRQKLRLYFYERSGDVRCVATVDSRRIEIHADSIDAAREAMLAKAKRYLTENADKVEEVEVEF